MDSAIAAQEAKRDWEIILLDNQRQIMVLREPYSRRIAAIPSASLMQIRNTAPPKSPIASQCCPTCKRAFESTGSTSTNRMYSTVPENIFSFDEHSNFIQLLIELGRILDVPEITSVGALNLSQVDLNQISELLLELHLILSQSIQPSLLTNGTTIPDFKSPQGSAEFIRRLKSLDKVTLFAIRAQLKARWSEFSTSVHRRQSVRRNSNLSSAPQASFRDSEYFYLLDEIPFHDRDSARHSQPSDDSGQNHDPQNAGVASYMNSNYYKRFFIQIKRLGTGTFGSVFSAQHVLDDIFLGTFAVKIVPVGDDRSWLARTLNEVRALQRLHHPNVVQYQHTWLEMHQAADFGPSLPCLFILMELANSGNLMDLIQSRTRSRQCLDETEEIWPYFIDIILGLRHLHHAGIIHRDLKPENLLLHSELEESDSSNSPSKKKRNHTAVKSRTKRVLITDFGQAVNALKYTRAPRTGNTGTMAYCAPELLFPSSDDSYSDDYSCSSDIYSLGVVLYVMCFGAIPFCDDSLESLQLAFDNLNQRQISFPTAFSRSKDIQELIRKMVVIDPQNRPTIDELISDPILLRHDHLHRLLPFVPTTGSSNADAQSGESARYLRPWRPSFAASTSEIEHISTQLVPLARASTSASDTSASIFPLVVSSPQVAPTIHQISTHSTPRHAASALTKVTPVNDSLLLSHIHSREAPPPLLLDAISSVPPTESAASSNSVIVNTVASNISNRQLLMDHFPLALSISQTYFCHNFCEHGASQRFLTFYLTSVAVTQASIFKCAVQTLLIQLFDTVIVMTILCNSRYPRLHRSVCAAVHVTALLWLLVSSVCSNSHPSTAGFDGFIPIGIELMALLLCALGASPKPSKSKEN